MWTVIKSFFGGLSAQVWEILAAVAASVVAVIATFQQGKKSERVKELETVAKDAQQAQDIRNKNSALPDGAAGKQLSDDWGR